MIATISAPMFDPDGHEVIRDPEPAGLATFRRRVSRTPTLDGRARINDQGYSDADRTLDMRWHPTQRQAHNVARMAKMYGRVIVCIPEGVFWAAVESYTPRETELRLVILVEKRLDQ